MYSLKWGILVAGNQVSLDYHQKTEETALAYELGKCRVAEQSSAAMGWDV